LLAGTAAPVIALANVVGFGDTTQRVIELGSMRRQNIAKVDHKNRIRNGILIGNLIMIISLVNLLVQAAVLFAALRFFADGVRWFSADTVEYILVYGMGVIIWTTYLSGSLRRSADEIKSAPSEPSAKPEPDPSA
jgi:hypothetical protein